VELAAPRAFHDFVARSGAAGQAAVASPPKLVGGVLESDHVRLPGGLLPAAERDRAAVRGLGLQFEDMLSLKSIANNLAPQVARLEPTVRAEVERLACALCRRPEIIAICGHALLVVTKSA
jgi:hypothetical protein